jgi:taurine dioxygenase
MSVAVQEQTLQITKIKEHIGAIATGVDLTRPADKETVQRLYDAAIDNVALVIRDQHFTAKQYEQAASLFGELMEDQNRMFLADGVPMVSVLSNRDRNSKGGPAKVGRNATWHADHTNQERPPKFTCLYPVALPDSGGGTSVCNMRAAYEALPEDLKDRIDGMQTANTLISSARFDVANPDILREQQGSKTPPTIQPLVRIHPERGSKAIWFHQSKTENILGMEPRETQEFLTELLDIAIKPEFSYTHEYKLGDMLIVDNCAAMHKAGFDYDHSQHRKLYRARVRGERPY